MIADIRAYLLLQVNKIDPDLKPYEKDLFGNNDVNKIMAQKYFNVVFNETTPDITGGYNKDIIDVDLELFSVGGRDLIGAFDALYDKALVLKDHIVNQLNWNELKCVNHIKCNTIEPIEENDNDNVFRVKLNFTVERFYDYNYLDANL